MERIEKRGDHLVSIHDRMLADGRMEHHVLPMWFDGRGRPAALLGAGAEGFIERLSDRMIITTSSAMAR
jgi:hypothetical protein